LKFLKIVKSGKVTASINLEKLPTRLLGIVGISLVWFAKVYLYKHHKHLFPSREFSFIRFDNLLKVIKSGFFVRFDNFLKMLKSRFNLWFICITNK